MDIKGIVRNVLPLGIAGAQKVREADARVKSDTADDRDANGQESRGEDERKRRNLSNDEIEEAKKILEALPGMKDSSLAVRIERNSEGIPSILIVDHTGKVVRRIPETEISQITANRQQKSGHLLNKAL